MRNHSSTKILSLLFFTVIMVIDISNVFAQEQASLKKSKLAAIQGDTTLVIVNFVKADKCEDFERFMDAMLNAMDKANKVGKLSAREAESLKNVRYLTPVK